MPKASRKIYGPLWEMLYKRKSCYLVFGATTPPQSDSLNKVDHPVFSNKC